MPRPEPRLDALDDLVAGAAARSPKASSSRISYVTNVLAWLVGVDGPFEMERFEWTRTRPAALKPDELVLQPIWAKERPGTSETNIHMHVPWEAMRKGLYLRLWYVKTPLIEVFEYIELFYNRQRRHSALDYLASVKSTPARL